MTMDQCFTLWYSSSLQANWEANWEKKVKKYKLHSQTKQPRFEYQVSKILT